MIVLGLSGGVSLGNQDAAAAVLVDGRLVAAAEEERFVGVKFANGYLPAQAIQFCLKTAGLSIHDVQAAVFAGATYTDIDTLLRRFFEFQFGHCPPLRLVDHHTAHAASAWFASGGADSLVVTWDNSGDGKSTTVWDARAGQLRLCREIFRPDSLGLFYSAVTQLLGFTRDSDEYKVMGMAAYGSPRFDLNSILEVTSDGYHFHSDFLKGIVPGRPQPSKHVCLFDDFPVPVTRRHPREPFLPEHFDMAASAQAQLERAGVALVRHWLGRTGHQRVCMAGGVALNCLLNQRIRELAEVDGVFVPPVSSDAGLALGAAYLVAQGAGDTILPLEHAYWGPESNLDEIRAVLDRAGARYRRVDDPAADAARLIAEEKIIAWFQGRAEYGPRALGNRSILASPKVADMKDRINQRVKFREEYRPLAPAIRHEFGSRYFRNYADSPFMTQTFRVIEPLEQSAPAVVHVDGTSRLQSVHTRTSPLFARLLDEVEARTGLPMVLNTSLNAYNDPMACFPHQALRTFFTTGIDALFLGDYLLEKNS